MQIFYQNILMLPLHGSSKSDIEKLTNGTLITGRWRKPNTAGMISHSHPAADGVATPEDIIILYSGKWNKNEERG